MVSLSGNCLKPGETRFVSIGPGLAPIDIRFTPDLSPVHATVYGSRLIEGKLDNERRTGVLLALEVN
jgi:hypothetical protein